MSVTASVRRGTLGDRVVRLSRATPPAVGAFRHCRAGSTVARWDKRAGMWQVPASIWPCIREALTREGVEIEEESAPVSDRFQRSRERLQRAQGRVQRGNADARWIEGLTREAERAAESADEGDVTS